MTKINFNGSFKDIIKQIILNHPALKKSYSQKFPNSKYSLDFILDEIIYVLKTGISWRNLRSSINWNTLFHHFSRFVKYNIFKTLFTKLRRNHFKTKNSNIKIIDSSFIPNKYGRNFISRNKFYKNKTGTKISLITDIDGIPLSILVNKGSIHDLSFIKEHVKDCKCIIKNSVILADKGYESKKMRNYILSYNSSFMIMKKKNMTTAYSFNKNLYRKRIKIENTFQKLKSFRRLMIRFDALIENFLSFIYIAASLLLLK